MHERTIGKHLKHYRLERNLNQTELAEKAGVARRTITSVENGKGCTLNTLIRLLKAMDQLHRLSGILDKPPIDPRRAHRDNMVRENIRKNASKPRKKTAPAPFVWGDEK